MQTQIDRKVTKMPIAVLKSWNKIDPEWRSRSGRVPKSNRFVSTYPTSFM